MDPRTAIFVEEYRRQRKALIDAFPELIDDEEVLNGTLDGISYAPDLISKLIRDAREDEAMAEAVASMARDMSERKARFAQRAQRRREAALAVMQAIELRKIEQPDFSASIRAVPPKVEIIDEAELPDALCKVVRSPDKVAIKDALAKGPVAGAQLSNGGETLTIRTK